VVAEFFIFAIVTTVVNERRRDIGILKAIGFTQGQICQVFLIVGLAIGVLGGLLGVGAGILFADNINGIREVLRQATGFDPFPPDIYYFTEVPAHVGYLTPILSAAGAIACSLLFSIFPALRAARMDPVETLRYE
jgi:lipoprotein-releasing system permease protein